MSAKHVVILGAGFAGLQVARRIANTDYDVTLIDRFNFHQFQPLFYEVATARLEPSSISFPLRKVFQGKQNVRIRIDEVESVDTTQNIVHIKNDESFAYDYLIIATGCTSNYFGNKNIERYAYPMKSTPEAIALRNRILLNFEHALNATPDELEKIMNIVIVGAGPTGVELAGALVEMKKNVLPRDYPNMDFSKLNIYLIEGTAHTLNAMSDKSKEASEEYLERMGVNIWLNTFVDDYDGNTVVMKDGRSINTQNLVWAAGVTGNVPKGVSEKVIVRGNRIKVDEYNCVAGTNNVFAIGDIAYMETEDWPKGHPQLANVAINQAKNMAKNLKLILKDRPMNKFTYKNPGTMATIGKRKAVVDLPFVSFKGFFAWLFWMFLHLMLIVSVKNRLFIFINWAISYFTDDTTLRLILLPTKKQIELVEEEEMIDA